MSLILKSFFRKKTTRIFLIIYTLIIISLLGLFYGLKILNAKEKENYNGAFIYINSTSFSKLKNINNINSYKFGLKLDDEYNFAIYNYSLNNNQIIIPDTFAHDKSTFSLSGTNITFDVKDYNQSTSLYEVSKEVYDFLKENYDVVLIVYLDDYLNSEKSVVDIKKEFNNEETVLMFNRHKYDYGKYIFIVKVFILVISFLFGIIVFFTSFNIVEEENEKNDIYYKIGYEKIFLTLLNIIKIILLLISSIILSSSIFYIIYTIYVRM